MPLTFYIFTCSCGYESASNFPDQESARRSAGQHARQCVEAKGKRVTSIKRFQVS